MTVLEQCAGESGGHVEGSLMVRSGLGASRAGLEPGEEPPLPGGVGWVWVRGGRPVKQMVKHQELIANGQRLAKQQRYK